MARDNIPRIIFRLGDIVFSKDFINLLKSNGIIISRARRYIRDAIVINHGNSNSLSLSRRVKRFYLINKPECIRYCANKWKNYQILKDFYPVTYLSTEDISDIQLPIIAKPLNGHHGYGVKYINDTDELEMILNSGKIFLLQEFIPVKHEFRFNVFDGDVFQVSHRKKLDTTTELGGFEFEYRSLGRNAKLKQKFWNFVRDVINSFHKTIPIQDLSSYCIDVMKSHDGNYYLSEINSAYGIGEFTFQKLLEEIKKSWENGDLEKYRIV